MRFRGTSWRLVTTAVLLAALGVAMVVTAITGVWDPLLAGLIAGSACARAALNLSARRAVDPIAFQWVSTPAAALKQFSNLFGSAVLVVIGIDQTRRAATSVPVDHGLHAIGVLTAAAGVGIALLFLWLEYRTRRHRAFAYAAAQQLRSSDMWDGEHHWISRDAESLAWFLAERPGATDWASLRSSAHLTDGARRLGDRLAASHPERASALTAACLQFVAWAGRSSRPVLSL